MLSMPCGVPPLPCAARAFFQDASRKHELMTAAPTFSALSANFNKLWATGIANAMEGLVDIFAMMHTDVEPQTYWLDTLVDELLRLKLDVLSSVIPIKDESRNTSTAMGPIENEWENTLLNLDEIKLLPETFTDEDMKPWRRKHNMPDHKLMLNTGCWVADLRNTKFWKVENGLLKFFFTQKDRIQFDGNRFSVGLASEDWNFSRICHREGLRLAATRIIEVKHHGARAFSNRG
jgi:hypothetical protein